MLFGIDGDIKTENVFDFVLLLAGRCLYKCRVEVRPRTLIYLDFFFLNTGSGWRNAVLGWAARVRVSLPGGNLAGLFLQANYALICLFFSFSFFCIFIHSMFMTYEILTIPMPHVLRCPMYVCVYVCNKDALKNVHKEIIIKKQLLATDR